jgi:hypothetical protein
MIGEAVLYAASRATHSAIENVTRRIAWTGAALLFLIAAFTLAVVLAFWLLQPILGDVHAAAAISAVCLMLALICLSMPWLIDRIERALRRRASAVATTVAAVDEEAKEAVDYFGAVRLVSAAFLFGMEAARRLRR